MYPNPNLNPNLNPNSNLNRGGKTPIPDDEIVPGAEPHPLQFVGAVVAFDCRRNGGTVTREKGQITEQRWLGFCARGMVPEYEVTVQGRSGRCVKARVTRDHVSILD